MFPVAHQRRKRCSTALSSCRTRFTAPTPSPAESYMSSSRLETLSLCLQNVLPGQLVSTDERLGELTIVMLPANMLRVMETLRDHADLKFEILIDLCGMDYSTYGAESA